MLKLPEFKERPTLNSLYATSTYTPEPRSFNLDTLMYWIKKTPECIGLLKRIATDIVTEISFVPVESDKKIGRPSKTQNVKVEDRAYHFARKNQYRQKLIASVIDWLATGDFYFWMGRLSNNQIKEIALKHINSLGIEIKEEEISGTQFYDEDWNGINSIEMIPASMMRIHHDKFKILKYIQRSKINPNNNLEFIPNEIIHGKFMEIDGSVYGYSPMEASYVVVRTINSIQDYNYYYFENGAKVDRVWKFMGNVNPDDVERFKQELKSYKNVRNAHGDLVLSGSDKIETDILNEISEKMEFRDIMINAAGRLAFAFNMPANTLTPILGKDIKQATGGSDVEDTGYNRNIIQAQTYLEEIFNTQFWIPEFKVEMRLARTFMQDKIRYVTYLNQATTAADWLMQHKYPLSDEFFHDFLTIPRKYLIEGKIDREPQPQLPQGAQLPNNKTIKGEASQSYQDSKKKQQEPQARNNPPNGS